MGNNTCSLDGCERARHARAMCSTHYAAYWRNTKGLSARPPTVTESKEVDCAQCGEPVQSRGAKMALHRACKDQVPLWKRKGLPDPHAKTSATPKVVAAFDKQAHARSQRSPLRAAYEDGNHNELLIAIQDASIATAQGCWEWSRKLDRNGYPVARIGKKDLQMHRVALEAKHGKPLGVLAAHHTCVNPGHLQPITHRENVAEMLARRSLEARINELETALAQVDPAHPVLNRIGHSLAA